MAYVARYGNSNIVDSCAFIGDSETARAVFDSGNIRDMALNYCYSIPGYADMPREKKNAIYDDARNKIREKYTA